MTEQHSGDERLARRLDLLFRGVSSATGRRVSMQKAADSINQAAGKQLISASYLSMLRTGKRVHVNHERLVAIADYFGVDVRYFTSDDVTDDPHGAAQAQTAITHRLIRDIAITADGLPEEDLHAILRLAQAARQLRNIPAPAPPVPAHETPELRDTPDETERFNWHASRPPLANPFSYRRDA